jgi:hypothetical protein
VERWLDFARGRRRHVVVPVDGRGDVRHRLHRRRGDGDLGVSFAIVGPLSKVVSMQTIFLVAGIAPVLLAAVAMYAARMRQDELANPLR